MMEGDHARERGTRNFLIMDATSEPLCPFFLHHRCKVYCNSITIKKKSFIEMIFLYIINGNFSSCMTRPEFGGGWVSCQLERLV